VVCDDPRVGITLLCIIAPCVLAIMGPVGYFMQKRRRPRAVRSFMIWYCTVWPMLVVALCGFVFPKAHWLEFVELGIVLAGYAVQLLDARRTRAKAGGTDSLPRLGL
jgi:hypothetical protein